MRQRLRIVALIALPVLVVAGCASSQTVPDRNRAIPGFDNDRRVEQINTPGAHVDQH